MPIQNPLNVKERIVSFIKRRGPSLPVHVAKEVQLSMLFASAFLSELIAERIVNISRMKVGGSPLYFLPGQENMLENFSSFLKNKEKEAYMMLKENKFLKDSELEPSIRVALRELRDFAFPFKNNEELFWKYLTAVESEFPEDKKEINREIEKVEEKPEEIIKEKAIEENITPISKEQETEKHKEEKQVIKEIAKKKLQKKSNKKQTKKQDDTFFNKVKEFLCKESFEITDIVGISKGEIILKIKANQEFIVFAFNKKKITEEDILKTYKKAKEFNLEYKIIFLGETPKRISEFISAIKNLNSIQKMD
jgi:outer membrane biosynthesis protein TonB